MGAVGSRGVPYPTARFTGARRVTCCPMPRVMTWCNLTGSDDSSSRINGGGRKSSSPGRAGARSCWGASWSRCAVLSTSRWARLATRRSASWRSTTPSRSSRSGSWCGSAIASARAARWSATCAGSTRPSRRASRSLSSSPGSSDDGCDGGREALVVGRHARQSATVDHRVSPGETLRAIAETNDTSVSRLLDLNALDDADTIGVGQVIKLPARFKLYLVRPGDTLNEIAAAAGLDRATILGSNEVEDPDLLRPGQELKLPV